MAMVIRGLVLVCAIYVSLAYVQGLLSAQEFDHFVTGFALVGPHLEADCESCHVLGAIDGTPRDCKGCHDDVIASGRQIGHSDTNDDCDVCHDAEGMDFKALKF